MSEARSVMDAAPGGDTAPTATGHGLHGIPVLITPFHQPGGAAASTEAMRTALQGFLVLQGQGQGEAKEDERKKWFREMRGWLMVLATVAASVTYQAGLNPPGGFWQDTKEGPGGHRPGNPVLRDEHWVRYVIFYYFNATAFVTSLVIMVLLMSERFYHGEAKVVALMLTTFVDLASLVGAYIAGTTRYATSCVYIVVITCVSFICVVYIGEAMGEICAFVLKKIKCMRNLAKRKWFPVPAGVVTRSLPDEEAEERRKRAARSNRPTCCLCCGQSPATSDRRDVEVQ
ncbi:hypothetical protein CFC21_097164 [Triticum aestivum]|uniref:PGG domain-containing protein n=4 Tax=Triticum TaxID=4564 RepID=A0A9R0ZAQ3_TRITD|nr:uncharacterized protein LOC123150182 [Triticum aestivum]XP_048541235.1 uncharacterized protein LOC125520372 [Triticum urartu]KAF7094888.1 hypothetical protein CFC21_097164 [Triticum aestivum]VAI73019.1 unnamed protein product [Triticum turgidum subsp. durum]